MRFRYFLAAAAVVAFVNAAGANPLSTSPLAEGSGLSSLDLLLVHDTCHDNYRTHGGAYQRHRHQGYDCLPVYEDDEEDEYDDCHRDVQRHRISGYGRVWHRHRGRNCRVEIYEEQEDDYEGQDCVQFGPVQVCP